MSNPDCCRPRRTLRPKSLARFAPCFRVLSDETRLGIVALLAAARGELCVCDIESHFALSQPTISHHLRLLRDAGVVRSERRGTWVYYSLDGRTLSEVRAFCDLVGVPAPALVEARA